MYAQGFLMARYQYRIMDIRPVYSRDYLAYRLEAAVANAVSQM